MIATSIEMSKHLLSLGLNPKTADMCYCINYTKSNLLGKDYYELCIDTYKLLQRKPDNIPSWSFEAMLKLMKKANRLELHLRHDKKWNLFSVYSDAVFRSFDINDGNGYESPLEAAYSMLCWLIENKLLEDNYIKD